MRKAYLFITMVVVITAIVSLFIPPDIGIETPTHTCKKVFTPQSEYQININLDTILVLDGQRIVAKLPLEQTCELGNHLLEDNQ
jgi:hypothetical protein